MRPINRMQGGRIITQRNLICGSSSEEAEVATEHETPKRNKEKQNKKLICFQDKRKSNETSRGVKSFFFLCTCFSKMSFLYRFIAGSSLTLFFPPSPVSRPVSSRRRRTRTGSSPRSFIIRPARWRGIILKRRGYN